MSPTVFKPAGNLDIATDAAIIPEDGMTRCKNLLTTRAGRLDVRYGSSLLPVGIDFAEDELRFKLQGKKCVTYSPYNSATQNVFLPDTRTRHYSGFTYNWGIDAPSYAPAVELGGGSALTGAYSYKITYCRKEGPTIVCESNPSPASDTITAYGDGFTIYGLAPTDVQVTHARIYRTLTGGASWFFVAEVDISTFEPTVIATYLFPWEWEMISSPFEVNPVLGYDAAFVYCFGWEYTEITGISISDPPYYTQEWESYFDAGTEYTAPFAYNDNTTDGNLGEVVATNHDRLYPGCVDVFGPSNSGQIYLIKDNRLYYCLPQQPEYWPLSYYIEVSPPEDPGVAGCFWNGQIYYVSSHRIFQITGTGHGNYFAYDMKSLTGTASPWGIASIHGKGIFHVGHDGIYLFSGNDFKFSQSNLDPIFKSNDSEGVPAISDISTSWLLLVGNDLWFGYDNHNVLLFNMDDGRVSYRYYPQEITYSAFDRPNKRILAASDVENFHLDDQTKTDDMGIEVDWEVQSKEFTMATRAHFPRWVKWDVDASRASDCAGALILDGEIFQEHELTGNRDIKRRLVKTGNGERAQFRIYGSGPATIYTAEME